MRLYDFPRSSASYRVRIACALKGLAPELVNVNLRAKEQDAPDYRAMAPAGLVPTLVLDKGARLTQSLAILRYIDHLHPENPLFPADAFLSACAEEIALTIACDIHPLNNLRVLHYLEDELGVDEQGRIAWYERWVRSGLAAVEAAVAAQEGYYCVGDDITVADVCLVPQLLNARRFNMDLADMPRLLEVERRLLTIPAFVTTRPEG